MASSERLRTLLRTIVVGGLSEDDLGGVVNVVGLLLLNNGGSLDSAK